MYSKFVCQTYGQTRAQSGDGKQDRLLIDIIQKSAKKRRCVCVWGPIQHVSKAPPNKKGWCYTAPLWTIRRQDGSAAQLRGHRNLSK